MEYLQIDLWGNYHRPEEKKDVFKTIDGNECSANKKKVRKTIVDTKQLNTYLTYALCKCQTCRSEDCLYYDNVDYNCELSVARHSLEKGLIRSGVFTVLYGDTYATRKLLADEMTKRYGFRQVLPRTTREIRVDKDTIKCSAKDVPSSDEIYGFSNIDNYNYWITKDDVLNGDIYYSDLGEINNFKEDYNERKLFPFYVKSCDKNGKQRKIEDMAMELYDCICLENKRE